MRKTLSTLCLILMTSCAATKLFNRDDSKKIVVAHRGASGYLPEHTLVAYAMAHSFNVDYIEPDLVMTKDNQLIIMHDIHLDKTTNVKEVFPNRKRSDGMFYAIDFTLKELKKLKVSERLKDSKRFPSDLSHFQIPSFEEFIELIQGLNKSRQKSIGIIPEIKDPEFHIKEGKDIVVKTLAVLAKYGYDKNDQAIIQCFHQNTLKRIKFQLKSKIKLFQLIADNSWKETSTDYNRLLTPEGMQEIATYAYGIGPWYPQLKDQAIMTWAHNNKLKVIPYTHRLDDLPSGVNNEEFLNELFYGYEVDGVFSDFSDNVMRFLKRN